MASSIPFRKLFVVSDEFSDPFKLSVKARNVPASGVEKKPRPFYVRLKNNEFFSGKWKSQKNVNQIDRRRSQFDSDRRPLKGRL